MSKPRYIKGYVVVWRTPVDIRPPVYLSIEGGIEAIRIWQSGAPTILLKSGAHATKEIAHIDPIYTSTDYELKKLLPLGKVMGESEVQDRILHALNGEENPLLTQGNETPQLTP